MDVHVSAPAPTLQAAQRRQLVHQTIRAEPGIRMRELAQRTGLMPGIVRHYARSLRRQGLVRCLQRNHALHLFPANVPEASWAPAIASRKPDLAALATWLQAHGPAHQSQVLAAMERLRGWPRSSTQVRLSRLVAHGLATIRPQGRLKFYSASLPSFASVARLTTGRAPFGVATGASHSPGSWTPSVHRLAAGGE